MTSRTAEIRASTRSPAGPKSAGPRNRTRRETVLDDRIRADRQLVDRCLAGEVAAWESLYEQCHPPLLTSIKILLGAAGRDKNLVDELAARVWYVLIDNDGELLAKFDPDRGAQLSTFLRALAKDEICRHFRSELRRRERELIALRERPREDRSDFAQQATSLEEFLSTLTPQESTFCREYLLAPPSNVGNSCSKSNTWQLSHRVLQKLMAFLGHES